MSFDFQFLGKYEVLLKSGITLTASLIMTIEEINLWLKLTAAIIAIPLGILQIIKIYRDLRSKKNGK